MNDYKYNDPNIKKSKPSVPVAVVRVNMGPGNYGFFPVQFLPILYNSPIIYKLTNSDIYSKMNTDIDSDPNINYDSH